MSPGVLTPERAGVIKGVSDWTYTDDALPSLDTVTNLDEQAAKWMDEDKSWWVIYSTTQPGTGVTPEWQYHGCWRGRTPEEVLDTCHVPSRATLVHLVEVGSGERFVRNGWTRG